MTEPMRESPRDLAAAYVLGALSPDETAEFEAVLAGSSEARRDVAEFRETAALLALGASAPAGLPDGLRDRVVGRIRGERPAAPLHPIPAAAAQPRRAPFLWSALAASIAAIIGLGFGVASLNRDLGGARAALTENERTLAELRRRLTEREATLATIFKPTVEMFQLTASGNPDPHIQLFWDHERRRALLYGIRLPSIPADRAYQLWFIQGGRPVPSVTFTPGADGHVQVDNVVVPDGTPVSAAAVTVEPAAGSPQPTSPIVMVGTLGKAN